MEVIQGYENLIEEYSKIPIYNPGMNYIEAVNKYKMYLIESALEENSITEAAKSLGITHPAISKFMKKHRKSLRRVK